MQELSLNILDIAENSVRAGAGLVRVTVTAAPAADRLTIEIEDDGSGMDEDTAAGAADPFYTTRTTRRVGLGLPYMKMNAELTGGTLEVASAVGVGTSVQATFALDHIDRMPLGDMGQTMSLLAGANPHMDFVYELRAEGDGNFLFDTRQVREVLGDVPLSEPEVMAYMASYIEENTQEITERYGI
jgi:nitrogen fixation/metabolism regulation signal transduction histidine kinase